MATNIPQAAIQAGLAAYLEHDEWRHEEALEAAIRCALAAMPERGAAHSDEDIETAIRYVLSGHFPSIKPASIDSAAAAVRGCLAMIDVPPAAATREGELLEILGRIDGAAHIARGTCHPGENPELDDAIYRIRSLVSKALKESTP